MSKPVVSDDNFDRAARRQLILYAMGALAFLLVLMLGLSQAARLTSGAVGTFNGAVDADSKAITIYLRDEPPLLDSMRSTDVVSGTVLGHVSEGLLRYDERGEITHGVADHWQQDGTLVSFHIRDNARWSNGEPITAHDFEFAWKTALDPATGSQYAFILYVIKNAKAANQGQLPLSEVGVTAVDDHTLLVELETPIAYFDKLVAFPTYAPVQEAFYQRSNGRYAADADQMLYNGPFMITSWVHGASLRMEKNPYYWDAQRARLNVINAAYITSDSNTLLNLFKDGQIVVADLTAEMLEEAMQRRWQLDRFMDGSVFFMDFNFREGRLTRNRNLRMAMHLAQDSAELVNRVIKLPAYLPAYSLFPVWLDGIEKKFREEYPAPRYPRNIPLAREYLTRAMTELGLERPPRLVMLSSDTPVARIQAEYYQEVFREVLGMEVLIDAQIFQQRLAKMSAGDFDMVLAGWGPDYNDPLTFADLYASWNLNNRGRYQNPALDELVRVGQSSLDPRERMDAFGQIQRILHEDVVQIGNYERGIVYATHPQLKGVVHRVFGAEIDYSYAWIETEGE
ncbi:MAG: peptide ABC transporter substrate-binding protein [Pseudomonadales bacterium]|nr:peptide ABC transporter substrate-binding protein [Pseudomonadales bacterium]